MNNIEVAQLIENCSVAICAVEGDEIYSKGSGVIIDEMGTVITANHVITNNAKLEQAEVLSGEVKILCKSKDGIYKPYFPITYDISLSAEYLKNPIKIDLAILRPMVPIKYDKFIKLSQSDPMLGEEIMIGGYPEDISLPFDFDKKVVLQGINGFESLEQVKKQIEMFSRMLVVKKAIISKIYQFTINGGSLILNGKIFYFDNVMHGGGSGGPVLNSAGELIGVISERGVIELNYEDSLKAKIPSGMGLALSCDPIFQYISFISKK